MLADTLGFCTWVLPLDCNCYDEGLNGDDSILGELYGAVTGIDTDEAGLLRLGERVAALERLQGKKHGYHSREHDLRATNKRLFSEANDDSPFPGGVIDEDRLIAELERYYELRGWDRFTGLPSAETMRRLGMEELLGLVG
jgi:aldehyde:ferredoxin oxidoreductase